MCRFSKECAKRILVVTQTGTFHRLHFYEPFDVQNRTSDKCMCLCVWVSVFAGKRGPESDIVNSDRGHTPKHGRPRIEFIV